VWAACTADVALRVVDLAVVSENPSIIIKNADPEIKNLLLIFGSEKMTMLNYPKSRLSSKLR
jgi:hypothetical protein